MRNLILISAIFCIALPVQAELIWHSALDGDATAIVGPDGVAAGSPTSIDDMNGNPGGAVKFDGANDYYNLGTLASTLSAGSMSFWARTDDHGDDRGAIAMGVSGGGASEYFSIQDRTTEPWRVDVDNGSARRDAFSDAQAALGTWHHVAATFAAGGDLKVYINGALQTDVQALTAGHDLENLGTWLVGAERVGSRYYNGALDDVRLYNSELSASEVGALSAAGPLYVPEPSTLALAALALLGFAFYRRR